jgi:predicted anti-sigma-YlaC factor YlaD
MREEGEGERSAKSGEVFFVFLSKNISPILALFIYSVALFFVDNHKSQTTDARSDMHAT